MSNNTQTNKSWAEHETILEIKNLHVEYSSDDKPVYAVNGIDLEIKEGQTLALVGETGAGKTSTALAILGLIQQPQGKITQGEIFYEGDDLLKLKDSEMESIRGSVISMIFQDPMTALNPVLSVGDQIAEVITLHEDIDKESAFKKAGQIMEQVGVPGERAAEYPHQFSGGMRQRIVIAIAIACEPRILLADEPTTALDVTIQAQVLDLIRDQIARLNSSMLLITHDLGVVAENANEVAIMYGGEILEKGSLADIFHDRAHPYTIGLFNSLPSFTGEKERLSPIPGHVPDPTQLASGCIFADRCARATEQCHRSKPEVKEISPGHLVKCFFPELKGDAKHE
ncbi:MAG: ABC transporter ATP-binding protein [Eubacteriales bacterium]|nr:ABC transporter ATP-binding protein [Eubacteriales bacterium]